MRPSDFLQKEAATQLCEHYMAAGAICNISTNCQQLLDAARQSFLPLEERPASLDFSLRFWVDQTQGGGPPWPQPYVRGLDHLVYAGFDRQSSLLADLRNRRVMGRFSTAMAGDPAHWRNVIFPVLMSILAGSIGLVELHASCVAKDDHGLVLIGPTCSGKSTLAMALTEVGFRFLSDDRTFCSIKQSKLLAYGLPRPLKLRREAACWFEDLRDRKPMALQGGERVFYCEPNRQFGDRPSPRCEPRALIVLERQEGESFSMTRARRSEVRARIEADLLPETPEDIEKQNQILDGLLALPCWRLQYGGRPQVVAEQVAHWFFANSVIEHAESRLPGGFI
jgi:hypothetical protein